MTSLADPAVVAMIARQELRVLLRSRWVVAYAAVFAVLAFGVGYFRLAVIEFTGFQSLDRTAAPCSTWCSTWCRSPPC